MLRSQKLPLDQPVTVLTDGGDSVRALVGDLPSGSEHHLDWFHVAMRLTGLGQYAKGLAHHRVLLQSSGEGKGAVIWSCSQAATSNREFTKAAWATMSSPPIPFTCPFLIIARVS
jgi:hypothetical protein